MDSTLNESMKNNAGDQQLGFALARNRPTLQELAATVELLLLLLLFSGFIWLVDLAGSKTRQGDFVHTNAIHCVRVCESTVALCPELC